MSHNKQVFQRITHHDFGKYGVLQVESFSLDQDELEEDTYLLSNEALTGADVRTVDPDTQARLEALLDAAGICPPGCHKYTVNTEILHTKDGINQNLEFHLNRTSSKFRIRIVSGFKFDLEY